MGLYKTQANSAKLHGESASKGHLAQNGSDEGRVRSRHKIWSQMLKFHPCSELSGPLDWTSQISTGVMLTLVQLEWLAKQQRQQQQHHIIISVKGCCMYLLYNVCPVTPVTPLPIWH